MNFVHPSRLQRIQQDSDGADGGRPRHERQHDRQQHDRQHDRQQHHHNQQSNVELATEAAFSQAQFQENGSSATSRPRRGGGDVGPLPAVHAIVAGAVHSVQSFGAFIAMDGFAKHGLVHVSQLSDRRVEQAADVVAAGQRVFVKVLAVSPDDGKLSLSMKLVDQRTGRDLDANHQEAVRYADGGGRAHSRPAPLQLDAVLNTTCSRCGRPGHLSNDCWMGRDDAKYELIGSDDEDVRKVELLHNAAAARASEKRVRSAMRAAAREARREKREHKRKSKHRHHRRHKHKSKRKRHSLSSSSSSSSSSGSSLSSSSSSSSSSRHSHSRSRRDRRDRDESKRSRSRSPRERRRSRSPRHRRERSRSPTHRDRDRH